MELNRIDRTRGELNEALEKLIAALALVQETGYDTVKEQLMKSMEFLNSAIKSLDERQ